MISLTARRNAFASLLLSIALNTVAPAQAPRSRVIQPRGDVTLEAVAVTYPNDTRTRVEMLGTAQFNMIKGRAEVERGKGRMTSAIKIDIGRLPHPSQVCGSCATYIAWAVTPEGQTDNLGEFRKRRSFLEDLTDPWFGSELETTTRHQTFSLLITAEPYYLVASPSRYVIVMNAASANGASSRPNLISFSGDSDFDNKIVSPMPATESADKKFPIELRQARIALEIAHFYEADRLDPKTYQLAESSYNQALKRHTARTGSNEELLSEADLAIRLADIARRRATSLARAEKERAQMLQRDEALATLEISMRESDARNRELESSLRIRGEELRAARGENTRLNSDLVRLREQNAAWEHKFNAAQTDLNARLAAALQEKTRLEAQVSELTSRADQGSKCTTDVVEINQRSRERVSREFNVTQGATGIQLSLSERIFAAARSTEIAPSQLLRLEVLSDYLRSLGKPVLVETYAQGCGSPAACRTLTESYAEAMVEYLEQQGVPAALIKSAPRGPARSAVSPQVVFTIQSEADKAVSQTTRPPGPR
jgi:outer membrane protein OmpA-like peptidoglycan-associated protein